MDPSVSLTKSWVDQPNTIRATSVTQMYTAEISGSVSYVYDVGRPPVVIPTMILIRNRSVSHDLHMTVQLPIFMTSSLPIDFVLTAKQSVSLSVDFNEPAAKTLSAAKTGLYDIPILVTVEPLLVNGPVWVEPDNIQTAFPSLN